MDDLERSIIALERKHPIYGAAKDVAIRELGIDPATYHLILNRMTSDPDALAEAPDVLLRVIRVRDSRQRHQRLPEVD